MKYVERECDVTELEKDVKNKWRWAWLSEKNDTGVKFEEWCQKVAVAGTCYCVPCGKTLLYANRGKKALSSHADDPQHVANHKSIRQTCTLDGATKTTSTKSKTKCQKQAPTKLGKRKSISGEDDIRSFFTKCKKMD
eukprot:TRINITY_DN1076_c0_g1_i1.p2 TRINITY_DN1076_c0_g1~~TRINITY_DN1076_c0_g1_i1.p2  ORF type:complete len:137 (-),score=29.46 TRINITY_DN1076_c0_g1_i1:635-1045(-)